MKRIIKSIMLFTAAALITALLAVWPITAFKAMDNSLYASPRERGLSANELSQQGAENAFVSIMYNRKNIYGERFLKYSPLKISFKEGADIFFNALQSFYNAGLMQKETYIAYTQLLQDENNCNLTVYQDDMKFYNFEISSKDLGEKKLYIKAELKPSQNLFIAIQFDEIKKAPAVSVESYLIYLGIDEFTDWQNALAPEAVYSENAQLYVYAKGANTDNSYFGVYPMLSEEFKGLKQ